MDFVRGGERVGHGAHDQRLPRAHIARREKTARDAVRAVGFHSAALCQRQMERLGGGGHMNASGAQFNHTDMNEAVACLTQVIDEMIEGGDI